MMNTLKIATSEFYLNVPRELNRTSGGVVIPSLLGFPYFSGSLNITLAQHRDTGYEVDLMRLQRPGQVFEVYDNRFNGPRADPGGVTLGASSPTLSAIGGDNQSISISGLPAGYVLSKGDYIGWSNTDGTLALHRAAENVTASGTGVAAGIDVEPLVRPGTATGRSITLVRPTCRALLVDTTYGSGQALTTSGSSLNWQQTNR